MQQSDKSVTAEPIENASSASAYKPTPKYQSQAARKALIAGEGKKILDAIYALRDEEGRDVSAVFQTLPLRSLTSYYKVISRPISLHKVKTNLANQRYSLIGAFIRDLAQITYNARLFNRKDSLIYEDALTLDKFIHESLETLKNTGKFNDSELVYPEIGPLPDGSDAEGDDGEQEEEDEEEEDEDDDEDADDAQQASDRRKRGRPPTVDRPHEHRIKAIFRGVRKDKEQRTGRLIAAAFDRLLDPKAYPDYYNVIPNPIALDVIRKNIKRRKYTNVEMFLDDMNLMFNNAKHYNAEGSTIFNDAVRLQELMMFLAEEELKKPDSVYQDPDSNSKNMRLPLDHVEHRGEIYKVGDWVHISNLNDPSKPTVGQIFRIWQAHDGQKWINACWYYRPEQTVHRYDKVFLENEVVKSGQYRDHLVDEILEKCFVMFFTKYQRGRPHGIGNVQVYCCENRYNEIEKTFNKIRTWKACIPDEVRSSDYPMDLFAGVNPLRKVPSPIRHLLPADARDDDPIPEPQLGVDNAPPAIGAVYKRPYDPQDPPEQPTPDDAVEPQPQFAELTPYMLPPSSNSAPTRGPGRPAIASQQPYIPIPILNTGLAPPVPINVTAVGNYGSRTIFSPYGPSSTFTLPEGTQSILTPSVATESQIIDGPDGQIVIPGIPTTPYQNWFSSPPAYIPSRRIPIMDPELNGKVKFLVNEKADSFNEQGNGTKVRVMMVGHSAKYLAWKLKKNGDKQRVM
ncbi:Bromodomain-containing protein [Nadsonia fulvescens var. elongata DSM 6958]|uniref:Bromodomain-containing protein n=1 Tax=Nadsonia fulvescens var. elongata DSM 6958 TaxID=857566 RepID=A0A1E3PRS6_9ASCO|nr:Bromodomain-containing protein [Nadsonia fulvescens var. elongata DSM 6958]